MKSSWRTNGKRIGAILLALLILAGAIPYTNVGTVMAAEDDGQSAGVTVSVTVKVPGTDEAAEPVAYAGAAVTVTYPVGEDGGTATVTVAESAEADGTYSAECADWTLQENDCYTLTVKPAEADLATYKEYSQEYTIEAGDISGTSITKEVTLERKPSYSIAVAGTENAGSVSVTDNDEMTDNDDTNISEGEARTVTAAPAEGYEITEVTVKAGENEWTPGSVGDTWWKDYIDPESGVFEYRVESIAANYEFMIVFSKKTFTLTYTLGANGKLTLNSDNSANAVEITTAATGATENVEYTDAAYTIKASVANDEYHLTSFVVDGDEKITDADIAGGTNAVKEKTYTFSDGINEAHTIAVTAEINSYTVTVNKNEGGTVAQGGNALENGSGATATSGDDITFDITPSAGYKVAGITVNGGAVSPADAGCTVGDDGSYQYTFTGVAQNESLVVTFAAVNSERKTLADSGLILKNVDGITLTPDAENVCYADQIIVSATKGKKLRLSESEAYQTELTVSASQLLTTVYMRDAEPSAFGTEQVIELSAPISLVIDSTSPVISLTDVERVIWKNGNESNPSADITGTVTDENPDRVVWFTSKPTLDTVLNEQTNVVNGFTENGAFSITGLQLTEGADTDIFYLYAVDKAGHCSSPEEVTVKRDGKAPEITGVTITPSVNQLSYGNFFHTAIEFVIKAKDVDMSEGTACHASGVQKVEIYAGDAESPVYTQEADAPLTGPGEVNLTVTIPIGEEEAFADLAEVRIKVTDQVGNVSGEYKLTDFEQLTDAGMKSDKLMLESDAPEINIALAAEDYQQTAGAETYYWYREIPDITYSVTDKVNEKNGSGLAAREVYLNDVLLTSYTKNDYGSVAEYESVSQMETETIAADDLSQMVQGENVVKIRFEDQAGNTAEKSGTIYMDTHAPEITGFEIEQKNTAFGKILNILSFGTFSNGTVVITVAAQDTEDEDKNTVPSSGLKEITLFLNGNVYATAAVTENGTATFELPVETLLDGKKYLYTAVAASVTDNVGNQSQMCDMTTANSNLLDTSLMIETIDPVIDITLGQQGYLGTDGIVFNNADTEFTVKVLDADSGLRSVQISINGTVLENKVYPADTGEAVTEDTYTVTTADAAITGDGLYTMTVTVVDNAGNQVETVRSVYKDETAPEILRFDMQAEGTVEADGAVFSEMDYGYYFHEDTRVTVYATDGTRAGDSGVREIRYYTVDANGTRGAITAVAADADGTISFVIPAEFKGQIYACAYDQLLNSTENYVNPSGLIVETAEQHAKEEHITYQKEAASHKDSEGEELYAGNVNVTVIVADTFSGIRKVEWSVDAPYDSSANQSGTIELDNNGNFITGSTADGWNKTRVDKNLVTELQKTIVVSNNSNNIVVHVRMTDRAGNTSEKEIKFGIDRTVPTIEVSFDNETPDAENTEMYKENRVATITVKERNFVPESIIARITNTDGAVPEISGWETSANGSNPDETVSTATIIFSEDGDYTLEISGSDAAGNVAETVKAEDFTIDKTEPVITVSYDTENAVNGNYFATERTATIQIEEHNFSPERVKITGTATDGGAGISFPQASGWSSAGDVHTATIVCGADGLYRFDVEFTDMAGNEAEMFVGEEYYVDMTEPEIEITGVEDMSANNGDVIPRVALSDTNYDANGVNIELTGANRGVVTPEGSYTTQAKGQIFTFSNFPVEQTCDDIYTLTATLTDMAGNESTETITFSVNRFGSVYVFDDSLKKIAGTYIQNEVDVRLTEVNVDSLEHDKIKVVVDANGTPATLTEGTEYTVKESGGNGSWYQYDYTIDKSLFAGDGRYIVTLYSEDVAGNVNENIDESKEAEITFGIDKTAPVVIPIDIESDTQYPVDVKNATVTVNDNLVLANVEVYIGDEKCEYTADGENYTFQVPSSTERRDITVAAMDAAGNRTNYVISRVLVTTNVFARWYNNKPLFVGSLVGVAGVSGVGAGVVVAFRRRRFKVQK